MLSESLRRYLQRFASLHVHKNAQRGTAPHKPVLLLALLDSIEKGTIRENRVELTPELVATFRQWWRLLVPQGGWQERIVYPFRYLVAEGFWELVRYGQPVATTVLGDPTTIRQLMESIEYGRFAPDLWMLLPTQEARTLLRETLLTTYFPQYAPQHQVALLPVDTLAAEAMRLTAEATQVRYRPRPVSQVVRESDAAYLRHYLFSRVVKGLYDHACAVCRLATRDDTDSTVVDAAHIQPFATFHNDDPRNGLALCKNHHWGFDRGWFGVSDDYTVLLSPHLSETADTYIQTGARLVLPAKREYAPAPEALAWHRTNVLQR